MIAAKFSDLDGPLARRTDGPAQAQLPQRHHLDRRPGPLHAEPDRTDAARLRASAASRSVDTGEAAMPYVKEHFVDLLDCREPSLPDMRCSDFIQLDPPREQRSRCASCPCMVLNGYTQMKLVSAGARRRRQYRGEEAGLGPDDVRPGRLDRAHAACLYRNRRILSGPTAGSRKSRRRNGEYRRETDFPVQGNCRGPASQWRCCLMGSNKKIYFPQAAASPKR